MTKAFRDFGVIGRIKLKICGPMFEAVSPEPE
jgi:hypothetical protein